MPTPNKPTLRCETCDTDDDTVQEYAWPNGVFCAACADAIAGSVLTEEEASDADTQ